MKSAYLIAFLAIPLSLFACATGTSPDNSVTSAAGSGGGGTTSSSTSSSSTSSSTSGMVGPCLTQADCVAFNDICNTGNCINGACAKTPTNEGVACDDKQFCTEGDSCKSGVCTGSSQKFCPSPDSCHIGQCDEATQKCGSAPGNDGSPCVDQDPCTNSGTCKTGVCIGGSPVDCSFLDGACSKGTCDSMLGCITVPLNDGAACNDNFYCTVNDVCKQGVCGGQPNTCAAPGDVCKIGVCNEAAKSCVAMPGNDGVMCEDGNPCTDGSTCAAGSCMGGQASNEGMLCDDSNACTNGTTCTAGSCSGPTMVIDQCVSGDLCCPAGCLMNDNDCSITKWSEGTQAWPDDACNPFNSFGTCDTNAQNHADAWATWVCQQNGFSLGIWTGNKEGGCNGDISMYCQNQIPCAPTFENNCQVGDQTKVEITCFP